MSGAPTDPARRPATGRRPQSLRRRLVLAFTAGGLGICLAFAATTYSLTRGYLLEQRHRTALRQAFLDANFLRAQLGTSGVAESEALAALAPQGVTAVIVQRDGHWFSSSLDADSSAVPAALQARADDGEVAFVPTVHAGEPALAVAVPLPSVDAVVYELAPLTELQSTLRTLAVVLSVGTAAAGVLAGLLGLWAARRVLRPLDPLASTAAAIASGDLARRLPTTDDPDLVTMVGSFNSMVDALQARIERDARFAADVSHELRSPLTTLVASADLLNNRAAELPPRSRQALDLLTADLSRFRRMLDNLLELARTEAGPKPPAAEPLDLPVLVGRLLLRTGRPPSLLHVEPGPATVAGDRLRLERALANLLDNADTHGGGVAAVSVQPDGSWVTVMVDDDGPGVPLPNRERIFERFATGGTGRGTGTGTGLGLALVQETAALHGGAVWCSQPTSGNGARFVLRLPVSP